MKYIITESILNRMIFHYLDLNLKGLKKRKPKYYEGIILTYPDKEHGILGWENDGTLYIYNELIEETSSVFGLDYYNSKFVIGRWFSDRYQLEVVETDSFVYQDYYLDSD